MLKFNKIIKKLRAQHGIPFYLLLGSGEVLLIVVGILLALQFDNWDKDQEYRKIEQQYYQDLITQLKEDKRTLLSQINYSDAHRLKHLTTLDIVTTDDTSRSSELAKSAMELKNYSDFRRRSTLYQTLVSSGDIKHIQNKTLISMLQNLESEYNYIERIEGTHRKIIVESIVPEFLLKGIRITDLSLVTPELLYSYQFENIVILTMFLIDEKTGIYRSAIKQIDNILTEIENPN